MINSDAPVNLGCKNIEKQTLNWNIYNMHCYDSQNREYCKNKQKKKTRILIMQQQ